jgi:hypothetical protein
MATKGKKVSQLSSAVNDTRHIFPQVHLLEGEALHNCSHIYPPPIHIYLWTTATVDSGDTWSVTKAKGDVR